MPFVSSCLQIFSASPLPSHGLALPLPGCDVRQARQLGALVSFPRHFACHYAATVSKLLGSSKSNERAPDDDGP
uniref:Uncharacterized protein n=1 Tax=Oryza nivara TaxID=4536 RepID=A0A0E0GNL9_ORYNI